MADKSFSDLVARANPSVPGCPTPTITNYLRDAAIKVCESTLAWKYEIPRFDLIPGVHEYPFDIPTNSDAHSISACLMNGIPLKLLNLDDAIALHPEWADLYSGEDLSTVWSETASTTFNTSEFNESEFNNGSTFVLPDAIVADASTPDTCCMLTPDKFIVVPLPDGEVPYNIRMFVSLKPKRSATTMAEKILDELEDLIIHKALEDLLVLPNVPWADRELSGFHSQKYFYHMQEKRARANLGHVRGSLSVRQRAWA